MQYIQMTNAPIFYVMGVSGCGKSTIGKLLAEEFNIPFFDGDDYHPDKNVQKMAAGNPLNDHDRQGWLQRLNALSKAHKQKGAVIACSALKQAYREILSQRMAKQVEFIYLKGTLEEISERLHQRKNHFMPPELLESQFNTLERPKNSITVSINNTPAKIVAEVLEKYQNKRSS